MACRCCRALHLLYVVFWPLCPTSGPQNICSCLCGLVYDLGAAVAAEQTQTRAVTYAWSHGHGTRQSRASSPVASPPSTAPSLSPHLSHSHGPPANPRQVHSRCDISTYLTSVAGKFFGGKNDPPQQAKLEDAWGGKRKRAPKSEAKETEQSEELKASVDEGMSQYLFFGLPVTLECSTTHTTITG